MAQKKCPSCGSYKTSTDRAMLATIGVVLVIIGFLFSFTIFSLALVPIGGVVILVACLSEAKTLTCRACGGRFSL